MKSSLVLIYLFKQYCLPELIYPSIKLINAPTEKHLNDFNYATF